MTLSQLHEIQGQLSWEARGSGEKSRKPEYAYTI